MVIGQSIPRVDAKDKALGRAKFLEDLVPRDALYACVLHSTIANGLVRRIDTSKAEASPGVVKVLTCFDVPAIQYPTAGHPWSLDRNRQDVADRKILNQRVRHYYDCIAAVVAVDERAARRALRSIHVEYDVYPPLLTPEAALRANAGDIHAECPGNLLKQTVYEEGDWDGAVAAPGLVHLTQAYSVPPVQHCHIENPGSFAYMENDRVVVVSSTQIPHIVRRVVAQGLGLPWGRVRVIKPYVGGGFGNKQDVIYEPLNAFLSMQVGGRCVYLPLSREETFHSSRTRHGITFELETWAKADGTLVARRSDMVSNQGAYASHGHTVPNNAASAFRNLYHQQALRQTTTSVYTNLCTAGAMRAYGVPQVNFAMESHMDDMAGLLGLDPIEFRRKNMICLGDVDKGTGIQCHSNQLEACLRVGKERIQWERKRLEYRNQTGRIRRGVGMAIFSYKSGAWPSAMEIGSARIALNQDGSVQVQMGATEIGQGADTVFTQMAAEAIGVPAHCVHIVSTQDTDVTPFDTGAYGSRQSYVSGAALKEACRLFREKLLAFAGALTNVGPEALDLSEGSLRDAQKGTELLSLPELAMAAFYHDGMANPITAEVSRQCRDNTYALGCCFAEIAVDLTVGRIGILALLNVHDSGRILNPMMALGQAYGGMAMGIGYALSEKMAYDPQTGRLLNGNLMDYKMPTAMDIPELDAAFVEEDDPSSPFGNKSLGEPPVIPVAAAIRNAVLHATGVAIHELPMDTQRLVAAFAAKGLI